jgi:hypothetical protein
MIGRAIGTVNPYSRDTFDAPVKIEELSRIPISQVIRRFPGAGFYLFSGWLWRKLETARGQRHRLCRLVMFGRSRPGECSRDTACAVVSSG